MNFTDNGGVGATLLSPSNWCESNTNVVSLSLGGGIVKSIKY